MDFQSERGLRIIGILLAAGGVVCFSMRPIFIKLAYTEMHDPVTLLALRMLFSLPFFLAVAAWTRRNGNSKPISRHDAIVLSILGFIGYYVASMLDFVALQFIPAGLGRLLLFLYPTIVVALSAIFLKKRVVRSDVVALVVTYLGIALVVSNAVGGPSRDLWTGVGLDFIGAVAFAVYLVAGSEVIARIGSLRFTAYAMIVASVAGIAQFLLLRPMSALLLSPRVYAIAVGLALVSTVVPVFMTSEALRLVGAKQVALIGALGPVTVIGVGQFGLAESMSALQYVGVALVLAGVVSVSLHAVKRNDGSTLERPAEP